LKNSFHREPLLDSQQPHTEYFCFQPVGPKGIAKIEDKIKI
jgi:hypothetical protein